MNPLLSDGTSIFQRVTTEIWILGADQPNRDLCAKREVMAALWV